MTVLRRATRSVPGSGEVWARYIRLLVCIHPSFYFEMSDLHQERLQSLVEEDIDIEAVEGANALSMPVDCTDFECLSYFQPCF